MLQVKLIWMVNILAEEDKNSNPQKINSQKENASGEKKSEEKIDYLSVLNDQQREAVLHEGSPLLILAGAGSGKTRVITTKIAYLIERKFVDPFTILALTFTKKAANEMKERACKLCPKSEYAQIKTFHSWGAFFLRKYYALAKVAKNFTVYDEDDMLTLVTKADPSLSRGQASSYVHKICLAKDYCLSPDDESLSSIYSDEKFRKIYSLYQDRLGQTGNVDFGDLIMKPYFLLKNNESLRKEIHARYKVILVDEYQDTNKAQFLLLRELSGVDEGLTSYVCVVGDDDQSIYKFRGAEIDNILTFNKQFPGAKIIRLETNYRSTQEILTCAESLVQNNYGRLGKTLVAARGSGKYPTIVFLPDQDDEVEFCSSIIEQAHEKNVPYSDWAILYRTNAQSLGFEKEFLVKKIPYAIVGSLKFYEREEIKDLLSWLAFVANPKDEVAFRRIVNKPPRGIGLSSQDKIVQCAILNNEKNILEAGKKMGLTKKTKEAFDAFALLIEDFEKMLSDQNADGEKKLSELIRLVAEKSQLLDYYKGQDEIAGTQKRSNIEELVSSGLFYPLSLQGLLDFLDSIQLDGKSQGDEEKNDSDRVTLITLHNTKGLEFNRVIITGMENGIFPREDKKFEELEEERRLFYVGITRAKNQLYFTSAACRRLYGRFSYMQPSIFLSEMDPLNLRVIGDVPSSFEADGEKAQIKKMWCPGKKVYHDDYGDGYIIESYFSEDDILVIEVGFDSGDVMRFMPEYQGNNLILYDDEDL